jgi:Ulp1 family protease
MSKLNDTLLSSKNDPDYLSLNKSRFEINKLYLEMITKYLGEGRERLSSDQKNEVIIKNDRANYFITRGSFERLRPKSWFNDELINGYINLINERTTQQNLRHAYIMSTFFYT